MSPIMIKQGAHWNIVLKDIISLQPYQLNADSVLRIQIVLQTALVAKEDTDSTKQQMIASSVETDSIKHMKGISSAIHVLFLVKSHP